MGTLIACPFDDEEVTRSGTWATVRRARKLGRRIVIIKRDGTIVEEAAREIVSFEAQRVCGQCETSTMCGSIHNGEPIAHEATGKFRLERWMRCDVCGTVTVWQEICTSDGSPLREFVSYPAPRMIAGAEAAKWVAERAMASV